VIAGGYSGLGAAAGPRCRAHRSVRPREPHSLEHASLVLRQALGI